MIDAHLHLWDLSRGGYDWITPDLGALHRDFTAAQARDELDRAGIAEAVLVQADDSVDDTAFLLATAEANTWIRGVVGWVRLDNSRTAAAQLERWMDHPLFTGVRHLVHDDPRDGFLALPEVRRSLALVAAAGLPLDVPDAFPRHLSATAELAAALPDLTVVVDHLGKPPPVDADAWDRWREQLARCAASPNTVAKLSGLQIPHAGCSVEQLEPVFTTALELFGPNRLMYGGDWPMTVPFGGYQPTWEVLKTLIGSLSPAEQEAVLAGTATRTYRRNTL
ncbi:amidohydrolase family protein [Arthrobacter sp. HLT1-21]